MLAKGYSRRAAAEMVGCHVATIGRTAAARELRYWRAGAWILERTDPERLGCKPRAPFGSMRVPELAQSIAEAAQPLGFSAEQLHQLQTRIEEFLTDVVANHQADAPAQRGQALAKSAGFPSPRRPTAPAASPTSPAAPTLAKAPGPPEPAARNTPPTASKNTPATQPAVQQELRRQLLPRPSAQHPRQALRACHQAKDSRRAARGIHYPGASKT